MASPFPGMDPYLESADVWPGFHHHLAEELMGQLNRRIGPKYYAEVNVRTVFEDITIELPHTTLPDVGIVERLPTEPGSVATAVAIAPAPVRRTLLLRDQIKLRSVEIHQTDTGTLITSIELLSPYNKRPGEGLDEYRRKRSQFVRSPIHLVEIDLLRGGQRPGLEVNSPPLDSDYILLVNRNRGGDIRESEIWPVALNEPLPVLPIPLASPDPSVPLEVTPAIQAIYARAGYDWRINYRQPVPPPELPAPMLKWLKEHLPQVGAPLAT